MRVRSKLILATALPFIVFMIILGVIMSQLTASYITEQAENNLVAVSNLKQKQYDLYLSQAISHIKEQQIGLGYKYRMRTMEEKWNDQGSDEFIAAKKFLGDRFDQYTEVHEEFRKMFLVDTQGRVIFVANNAGVDEVGRHIDDVLKFPHSLFDSAKEGVALSDILMQGEHAEDHKVAIGAPINLQTEDNVFVGEMVLLLSLETLLNLFDDRTGLGDTGETLIAHRMDNGGAHFINDRRFPEHEDALTMVPAERTDVPIIQALKGNETVLYDSIDYRGEGVIAITSYLPELDWGMVVKMDVAEAQEVSDQLLLVFGLIVIVMMLAYLVLLYAIAKRFTDPILSLTQLVRKVGSGDLSQKTDVKNRDEVGELASGIDTMTAGLREGIEGIEAKVKERTAELEKVNSVMVGREKKMMELKNELSKLKGETNEDKK